MSLASGESKSSCGKKSWLPLSWGVRFALALVGAHFSFWLASRQNVHSLPALPTFLERFWLVAPTLLEGTAGLLFLLWAGTLLQKFKSRPKRKSWTTAKCLLLAPWVLTTLFLLGEDYPKYLWPSYQPVPWMFKAMLPFNLLLFMIFFEAGKSASEDEQVKPRSEWWITAWAYLAGAAVLLVFILPFSLNMMIAVLAVPFLILVLGILAIATSQMRYLGRSGQGLGAIALRARKGQAPLKKVADD
jgi:VanZ family protein